MNNKFERCAFCLKGDKDFRDPKNYKLHWISDPLDRDMGIYAHKSCIVYAAPEYQKFQDLKKLLREILMLTRDIF